MYSVVLKKKSGIKKKKKKCMRYKIGRLDHFIVSVPVSSIYSRLSRVSAARFILQESSLLKLNLERH